ncbi:MAG: GntR family transcriptional regulator [Dorea sp.]|nr:GntR family transcriptional regulator [Dorea sp.]
MAEKTASLARQAYKKIKQNILDLTYPPGMPLTEALLTKELQMSRSPVRSAIQKLQTEGLLVSDYYKSITVKEITQKDIIEIYQLRELIEEAAFRLIFSSGRNEEYSYRIEEKIVRMCAVSSDLYEWEVADAAMHLEIISIFDNDRINRIYKNNLSEFIRIGQYSVKNGMHIPQTNANLRNMVRYMREENFEKSYDILRTLHLESGMDNALKGR